MRSPAPRVEVATSTGTSSRPIERRPARRLLRNGARADFAARVLATLVLAGLIALGLPQLKVAFTLIKIGHLIAIELGLVSLLLGLFLGAKTSFAGLQLIVASSIMLSLHARAHPYAAAAAGTLMLAGGLASLAAWRNDVSVPFFEAGWARRLLNGEKRRSVG